MMSSRAVKSALAGLLILRCAPTMGFVRVRRESRKARVNPWRRTGEGRDGRPAEPACHGTNDASSCLTQPATSSPPRATTQRRWTTSQTPPGSPNPCCTSTSHQNWTSTWTLLDQSCDRLVEVVEEALASTDDNADRVIATVAAFYEFISSASGEFRFVFESDLTGDGAVQQRLSRVNDEISDAIAGVIAEDTSLPAPQAKLLAVSLVGIAQVSARYWISGGTSTITLEDAKQLVSSLAWRGISGFPLTEHDRAARTNGAADS